MSFRIITLGTGAGRPTLQRLTSATALEYEGETFLFDCGEGVQIQLIRSPLKWGKMKAIFIGHMHGDHLNGLPGLLGTLSLGERQEPLHLFGPQGLKTYLQFLQDSRSLWINYPLEIHEIQEAGLIFETLRYQVFTAPLSHSITCWGYAFRERPRPGSFDETKAKAWGIPEGPLRMDLVKGKPITLASGRIISPESIVGPSRPGRSMAYCLDTRPCEGSLALAQRVDFLVHEATFGHEHQHDASVWGHSTAADAARIALESGAKQLIMTHISQRYLDSGLLLQEAKAVFPQTNLAADLAEFKI